MRVVGLMSGTSMDGIDAALLEVEGGEVGAAGPPHHVEWELLAFRSEPYTRERRRLLRRAVDRGSAADLCRLHGELGRWLGEATVELLDEAGVDPGDVAAVGSHGHTVWHHPPDAGRRGATLQLGDPATLAALTGIPVVSDFRSADVAAGGQGAPLVAWPDAVLFRGPRPRALQNLGGIGNVTRVPGRGDDGGILAFDTGPGNALVDAAVHRATGGAEVMDRDGRRAVRGTVDPGLLRRLLDHPFLRQEPPRSTGREVFGPALVAGLADEAGLEPGSDGPGWDDLVATLTAFTVESVARALRERVVPEGVEEVVVTGGGARNPVMVTGLRRALAPLPVRVGREALGMDPDAREAAAFAVLAWAHLREIPANAPRATGASGPRILGSLTPAPGRPGRGPGSSGPRDGAGGGS